MIAIPTESRRPRWIVPLGVVLATLIVTALVGYRYWTSTPQYSLMQAKGAFEARDLGKFEQYVAIDQCADTFTNDMFAEASAKLQEQSASLSNPFAEVGRKMAEGLMGTLKPVVSAVLKTKARELVSTSQMTPPQTAASTGPVDLEGLKNNIKNQGVHFEGIGNVGVEGDTATVELRFHNDKQNSEQPVELEMYHFEGHWQVTSWKNATQWIKQSMGTQTP